MLSNSAVSVAAVPVIPQSFGNWSNREETHEFDEKGLREPPILVKDYLKKEVLVTN